MIERVFFVLDTSRGVIHLFKSLSQDKPSESFSISNGSFPEKLSKSYSSLNTLGIVSDPETGKIIDSFEFRTVNGLQFTVLAEDSISVAELKEAFFKGSLMAPVKRSLAQNFGKGVFGVVKVPWKLTKVMVLSLEKVR
jgi:hypothetical protein